MVQEESTLPSTWPTQTSWRLSRQDRGFGATPCRASMPGNKSSTMRTSKRTNAPRAVCCSPGDREEPYDLRRVIKTESGCNGHSSVTAIPHATNPQVDSVAKSDRHSENWMDRETAWNAFRCFPTLEPCTLGFRRLGLPSLPSRASG